MQILFDVARSVGEEEALRSRLRDGRAAQPIGRERLERALLREARATACQRMSDAFVERERTLILVTRSAA